MRSRHAPAVTGILWRDHIGLQPWILASSLPDRDCAFDLVRGSIKKCGQASRCGHKARARLWSRRHPRKGPEAVASGRCRGHARLRAGRDSRSRRHGDGVAASPSCEES